MKKLTAEKCREWIVILSDLEESESLSISGESHLQAYRFALQVLEHQEAQPQIDNEGWVEWRGGKRPVDSGVIVATMCRNGVCAPPEVAVYWGWGHNNSDLDIIAYRVIENDGREG